MEPGPRPWRTALIFPIDISCSPHFPALFLLEKAPLAAALFSPPPSVHFSTYTPSSPSDQKQGERKKAQEKEEKEKEEEKEKRRREKAGATRRDRTEQKQKHVPRSADEHH